MRYFITGATGFIGGHVARQLLANGHDVIVLAREPMRARELVKLGATVFEGDVTNKDTMREPMNGVDGVFHLAAWYKIGVPHSSDAPRINVNGTRNVLQMMRDMRIAKGVYTSTVAVYGDTKGRLVNETYRHEGPWISQYDKTKWEAHYEVALPMMREGLPLVTVQPGATYGPGDTSAIHDMLVMYLRGKMPMSPAGAMYCWAHVEDTARAHIQAMEKGTPGESYNICGPAVALTDVLTMAERITGVGAPRIHPPGFAMRLMASVVGPMAERLPTMYHPESLRASAGTTYIASNEKAVHDLGLTFRSLDEGLRETLEYEARALGKVLPARTTA